MRQMKGFITIAFDEVNWEDDKLMTLPKGIKTKILAVDQKEQMLDQIHEFPAGYAEPRHTHDSSHHIVVLDGKMIIEGKTLTRGGYVYAQRNIEHGPYEYPEGCTVFIHFVGPSPAHKY